MYLHDNRSHYLFQYQPVTEYPIESILAGIKLETALISYSFPTEEQEVSSILFESQVFHS